eukprot:61877-Hanusia_phi.AAC.1
MSSPPPPPPPSSEVDCARCWSYRSFSSRSSSRVRRRAGCRRRTASSSARKAPPATAEEDLAGDGEAEELGWRSGRRTVSRRRKESTREVAGAQQGKGKVGREGRRRVSLDRQAQQVEQHDPRSSILSDEEKFTSCAIKSRNS